tara:strand:- start:93 stop:338 length:246 start_codon:yes stop_codon:yes gene_type:complete
MNNVIPFPVQPARLKLSGFNATRIMGKKDFQTLLTQLRRDGCKVKKELGAYTVNLFGAQVLKAFPGNRVYVLKLDPRFFEE